MIITNYINVSAISSSHSSLVNRSVMNMIHSGNYYNETIINNVCCKIIYTDKMSQP